MSLLLFKHPFWSRDFLAAPLVGEENFEVNLNVEHFKPDEVQITLTGDNVVVVEGKHEEKKEEDGSVTRHFVRKFTIPKGYDVGKIQGKWYSDGILNISAPRVKSDDSKVRNIPVKRIKGDAASFKSKL